MVCVGVDATPGAGLGLGLQTVLINKGKDQGVYLYTNQNLNLGMNASGSVVGGAIDFNESNSKGIVLNRDTFTGKGMSISGGVDFVAGAYIYASPDGEWRANPFSEKLYSGFLGGYSAGLPASCQLSFSECIYQTGKKF